MKRLWVVSLREAYKSLERGRLCLHGSSLVGLLFSYDRPVRAALAVIAANSLLARSLDIEVELDGLFNFALGLLARVVVDMSFLGELVDHLLWEHVLALGGALVVLDKQVIKVLRRVGRRRYLHLT